MVLHAKQIFDKVFLDREHPSDFIEFVADSIERELVNKFMGELEDHKPHVVVLK